MPMNKRSTTDEWKSWIFENGSYKLVALFVTLILWVTILGRRDFVLSKEMDVEFLLPRAITIAESNIERRVMVKVSGPRMALKKFAANPGTITIDLMKSQIGPARAMITPKNVEVPFGVKVIAVNPDLIRLTLIPTALEKKASEMSDDGTEIPASSDDSPITESGGSPRSGAKVGRDGHGPGAPGSTDNGAAEAHHGTSRLGTRK